MKSVRRSFKFGLVPILLAFLITTIATGFRTEARADGAGAFVGGMVAGHVLGGFIQRDKMRTAAEMDRIYGQRRSQTVYVQQPAPATTAQPQASAQSHPAQTTKTVEQRLNELDQLAKGGYITPEEYKAKKKAILDSI